MILLQGWLVPNEQFVFHGRAFFTRNGRRTVNKKIALKESIAVLVVLLAILGILIIGFQLSPHIPILTAFMCLLFYGRFRRFSWDDIHDGIVKGITPGIIPILIFLLIGVLVASWILSGTIPTIMVYGFQLISVRLLFTNGIFSLYDRWYHSWQLIHDDFNDWDRILRYRTYFRF